LRNIRLIIQFDGTDFCGWQIQDGQRTVQGDLTAALCRLTGSDVSLVASSRTDSGVHAMAMPVSFRLDTHLPLKAFVFGVNALLAKDVRVVEACEVPTDFHARFSAKEKTYVYRVQNGRVALPLERRHAWHVPEPLDLDAMEDAARRLIGTHDFSAFRSAHCDAASPVRTLVRVDLSRERPGILAIEVESGGFLRNMVRILAGTLVAVGRGRHPPSWIDDLLDHGDRTRGGQTAPPQGLFLKSVRYR
jgi:tRNA pseudouridine38-40 synthase